MVGWTLTPGRCCPLVLAGRLGNCQSLSVLRQVIPSSLASPICICAHSDWGQQADLDVRMWLRMPCWQHRALRSHQKEKREWSQKVLRAPGAGGGLRSLSGRIMSQRGSQGRQALSRLWYMAMVPCIKVLWELNPGLCKSHSPMQRSYECLCACSMCEHVCVNMCVHVFVCVNTCERVCEYACVRVCLCVNMCVHVHTCVNMCVNMCVNECVGMCVCVNVCARVCLCVNMCANMCVCVCLCACVCLCV